MNSLEAFIKVVLLARFGVLQTLLVKSSERQVPKLLVTDDFGAKYVTRCTRLLSDQRTEFNLDIS